MALTPSLLSAVNSGTVVRTVSTSPSSSLLLDSPASKIESSISPISELSDNLQTIKDSSLLYQLISSLLLTPEQDKQLTESLSQPQQVNPETLDITSTSAENSALVNISSTFQVQLSLEVSIIEINQQSFTVTSPSGNHTEVRSVTQAASISIELTIGGLFQPVQESDPLVIDVNNDGIATSGIEAGALFDIDADGLLDKVSIPTDDNAFLALDINGNGIIDNGSELFGDQNGHDNGFSYLATFDDNNDRLIDKNDNIFNNLLMMRLVDNKQFILELANTDITSIALDYSNTSNKTSAGDKIVQLSEYKNSEGQEGRVADLLLKFKSGINSKA